MNYFRLRFHSIRNAKPLYLKNPDSSENFLSSWQDSYANPEQSFEAHASFFNLAILAQKLEVMYFLLNHSYPIHTQDMLALMPLENSSHINVTHLLEKVTTINYAQSSNIIAVEIQNYVLTQNPNIVAFKHQAGDANSEYFLRLGFNANSCLATIEEIEHLVVAQNIQIKPLRLSLVHALKHNSLAALQFLVEGQYFKFSRQGKIYLMELAIKNSHEEMINYFLASDKLMLHDNFSMGCAKIANDSKANEMLLLSSNAILSSIFYNLKETTMHQKIPIKPDSFVINQDTEHYQNLLKSINVFTSLVQHADNFYPIDNYQLNRTYTPELVKYLLKNNFYFINILTPEEKFVPTAYKPSFAEYIKLHHEPQILMHCSNNPTNNMLLIGTSSIFIAISPEIHN
jgi:hypothetical protein